MECILVSVSLVFPTRDKNEVDKDPPHHLKGQHFTSTNHCTIYPLNRILLPSKVKIPAADGLS